MDYRIWRYFLCFILLVIGTACCKTIRSTPINDRIHQNINAINGTIPFYKNTRTTLLHDLELRGVIIIKDHSMVHLFMPEYANFKSNSSVVQPYLMLILNYVAAYMDAYPRTRAIVHGNTDSIGSVKFNQALSERRAHAVIAYIESQGILVSRFETCGYSELNPIANNKTPGGRLANRRIEITLISPKWI